MPHESSNSGPTTAPTSTSAPKTPLSESAFLTKQAAEAKAAISRVMDDVKHDLAQGADPRAWMQAAPWTTLGVAAAAGFVAAAALVPSKEQQALKRLKKIEEALNPRYRGNGHNDAASPADVHAAKAGRGSSFLTGLATQLLHAVQPVLMSAITAGVTAKTVKDEDEQAAAGGTDPGSVAYGQPNPAGGSEPPQI